MHAGLVERKLAAILAADVSGYSRMMEVDEAGTLARLRAHISEVVRPRIAAHRGNIVKTSGDGLLAEFASIVEAVESAVEIQRSMAERNTGEPEDSRILYRVGINLGDVLFEDGDVFGDGVNVASRLEGLAKPGGLCISDIVHQAIADRIEVAFRDMGNQRVKNISRPIRVWQWTPDAPPQTARPVEAALHQRVQFATASDGVQIAWASIGQGAPVLKGPNWMNHLEYEWHSPIWRPLLARFANICHLVRFDQRGSGLSDWDVETVSEDAMAGDMRQ